MTLKLNKIYKIFAKHGFDGKKMFFGEDFANLVNLLVHSLIKMKLSPMQFYWL